ncbi:Retrovirus-related Pol polyprotein from transposon TNT 1-94 [Sesamum angolense]|uniref:Retrovirus-related Pol polyprotein from transposon TNT 1-94 n=1 Tax=Sesamum angolense TaxID=2727404 RepID=A0AAE1WQJ6_9LAMI|nr:Retrovirus-related Pol polyprotein from transposon TNT 1-94 [Sesamum angolense]
MSSMAKNNVWELVDLTTKRKTIGNKWVLKVKRKADGSINKFKARLVAKGYTQKKGIDYEETFSPIVRFASVRLILAIVAHLDLELFQMDAKTAFLNGELDEEIYIDQPERFQETGKKRKVRRLKRSIYSLKNHPGSAMIAYAKDPKYHGRTKHINTRYHFIRNSIAQGEVVLKHIPTNNMIVDPFTKSLRRDAFHRHALIGPLTRAITLAL